MDKCVSTFIDSTLETFHLPLFYELPPSLDPGHKKFWKRETGSMSTESPRKICIAHVSIVTEEYLGFTVTMIFELSSNCCIIAVLILTVI